MSIWISEPPDNIPKWMVLDEVFTQILRVATILHAVISEKQHFCLLDWTAAKNK